jgi:hypothetical protein
VFSQENVCTIKGRVFQKMRQSALVFFLQYGSNFLLKIKTFTLLLDCHYASSNKLTHCSTFRFSCSFLDCLYLNITYDSFPLEQKLPVLFLLLLSQDHMLAIQHAMQEHFSRNQILIPSLHFLYNPFRQKLVGYHNVG